MTFYSRCQPAYLLLAVGIVVLVTGNPSKTCPGMSQVEEDQSVLLDSCVSGPALPCSLQFQTRPAHPHGQEQESTVCAGVGPNQSYDTSRRCDCWWSWWNGILPSSATPATGWRIYVYYTMYIHCIYHIYTWYIQNISYIYT